MPTASRIPIHNVKDPEDRDQRTEDRCVPHEPRDLALTACPREQNSEVLLSSVL
jgi:hypothetical protein